MREFENSCIAQLALGENISREPTTPLVSLELRLKSRIEQKNTKRRNSRIVFACEGAGELINEASWSQV